MPSLIDELRDLALRQGFVRTAVAAAEPLLEARATALARIRAGHFAGLPWFDEDRVLAGSDPPRLFPGARSVVMLAAPYAHPEPDGARDGRLRGRVSRYAWGGDYHKALERRARPLKQLIAHRLPGARSRIVVDHSALLDRAYARAAGVGWQGKNTMLLVRGAGSYVFLTAILTSAELEPDEPIAPGCGSCQRCLPACPTGALRAEGELVNDLCISFQTIENHGPIPRQLRPLIGDWVFGCDLCQDSCPVNERTLPPGLGEFAARDVDAARPDLVELLSLGEEEFARRFAGRALLRAKYAGILRNACVALGNLGDRRAVPALALALEHPEPLVRGHAAWALGRLGALEPVARGLGSERDLWVREEMEEALRHAGN